MSRLKSRLERVEAMSGATRPKFPVIVVTHQIVEADGTPAERTTEIVDLAASMAVR